MKYAIFLFSVIVFVFLNFLGNLTNWENIAVCTSIYLFLIFLDNLGKKIVVMDLAVVLAFSTCLILPIVFYHVYTKENVLARIWVKYMPVPSDRYFSFAVPAVIALHFGLRVPLGKLRLNKSPFIYMENVKRILQKNPSVGIKLIQAGVISSLLDFLSPGELKQIFYFFAHLTFVGVFYVIYSPNKYKRIIVPLVFFILIGQSVATGMFGDFIYILACSSILLLLGKQISFFRKVLLAIAGVFLVLIIQSIKGDYRQKVWGSDTGADPVYYASLIVDRISDPATMFNPEQMFGTAVRMNQGWLVAMTMDRVPSKYEFGHGKPLWEAIAAAIVPRFLWPDKPEAGGKANLKRFWGYDLVGYSMNLGTLGEAYANFDVEGGIVYMFMYGLFFNLMLSLILKLSEKRPTLVLWIPFLFFYAISTETDLLTTMGSLLKGVFFTWIIFRLFKVAFRIDL